MLRLGTLLAVCPLIIEFVRTRLGTHGGKGLSSERCNGLLLPLLGQRGASSKSSKGSHTLPPSFQRCNFSARRVRVEAFELFFEWQIQRSLQHLYR